MGPRRLAAAGAVAVALAGCGSTTPGGGTGTPATTAPGSAVTPAQAARDVTHAFGAFRRPARPGDEIPTAQADGGVKPEASRLVYSGPLGMLYAYVHGGLMCVSYATRVSPSGAGSASGTCASAPAASATGVAAPVAASFDGLDRLALLVPDGVTSVTIGRAGVAPVILHPRSNAVVFAGAGLRGWSYMTRSRMHITGALPRPPARSPGHP